MQGIQRKRGIQTPGSSRGACLGKGHTLPQALTPCLAVLPPALPEPSRQRCGSAPPRPPPPTPHPPPRHPPTHHPHPPHKDVCALDLHLPQRHLVGLQLHAQARGHAQQLVGGGAQVVGAHEHVHSVTHLLRGEWRWCFVIEGSAAACSGMPARAGSGLGWSGARSAAQHARGASRHVGPPRGAGHLAAAACRATQQQVPCRHSAPMPMALFNGTRLQHAPA